MVFLSVRFFWLPSKEMRAWGQRRVRNANRVDRPEFYLLDGQQRWSAVSLGFRDIWLSSVEDEEDPAASALWIDLEPRRVGTTGAGSFSVR